MSLPKSSHNCREAWCHFALQLQRKHIIDHNNVVQNKRTVFDRLYNDADPHQTELNLVISGVHPVLSLVDRDDLNDTIEQNRLIQEATCEVMKERAAAILRNHPPMEEFAAVVKLMVEAMMSVYEDPKRIDEMVAAKVK